ncbi:MULTISPECIES: cation:proton antiporter [Streptomycetaceae]
MKASLSHAAVLAGIAVVLLAGVALTPLRRRLHQPVVVGEIAAGLLLGPSVLGLLPGHLPDRLFPAEARPHLATVAQVGIVLYLFTAGWELDLHLLRGRLRSVLAITAASLAVPFLLAVALALTVLTRWSPPPGRTTSPVVFALFMGVVMSISALAVLARIVGENGLHATRAGAMAIASGAVTELFAWSAVVVLLATAHRTGPTDLLGALAPAACYAVVMLAGVRPLLARFLRRADPAGERPLLLLLVTAGGVLLSACATERLGVHAVLGAFLFGLVMPRDLPAGVRRVVEEPLRHTGALLLPVFFALAGLSVDIGALGTRGVLECAAFLCVAWGGKFTGAYLTARLLRLTPHASATLSVLVNSRGLSEVLILSLGRQAGLIDAQVFTAMLLTALLATASVNPLVRLLAARTPPAEAVPLPAQPAPPVPATDEHA